jgi:hypothetical protein
VALRTAGDVATPEALEELNGLRFRAFLRVADLATVVDATT